MKTLFYVRVLSLIGFAIAGSTKYPRGCLYLGDWCMVECPEGTHSYTPDCGRRMPEPTCFERNPVPEKFDSCNYSACYCDPPTIRHTRSMKCVLPKDCMDECPKGTHSYTTNCSRKIPEPTCSEPNPVAEKDILCDYSDCYCNPPTIRDTKTNKCVLPKDCTPKE